MLCISHSYIIDSFLFYQNILCVTSCGSFLKKYLFIFRESGREGEGEGEKHQCVRDNLSVASCMLPTGDLACNPGMCPDWELNQWSFDVQAGTQSTEPYQPGPSGRFYFTKFTTLSSISLALLECDLTIRNGVLISLHLSIGSP